MNSDSHLYTELSPTAVGAGFRDAVKEKLRSGLKVIAPTTAAKIGTTKVKYEGTHTITDNTEKDMKCRIVMTNENGEKLRDVIADELKIRGKKFAEKLQGELNKLTAKKDGGKSIMEILEDPEKADGKSSLDIINLMRTLENVAKNITDNINLYKKEKVAELRIIGADSIKCTIIEDKGDIADEKGIVEAVLPETYDIFVTYSDKKTGKTKKRERFAFSSVCIGGTKKQAGGAMKSIKNENMSDTSDAAICE